MTNYSPVFLRFVHIFTKILFDRCLGGRAIAGIQAEISVQNIAHTGGGGVPVPAVFEHHHDADLRVVVRGIHGQQAVVGAVVGMLLCWKCRIRQLYTTRLVRQPAC